MSNQAGTALSSSSRPDLNRKLRGHEINIRTIRNSLSAYIGLDIYSESNASIILDELSVHTYIVSALTQLLGLTGAAISFDILKVKGSVCWIRMAREDLVAVLAAVTAWHGALSEQGRLAWRIIAKGNWLSCLIPKEETGIWDD